MNPTQINLTKVTQEAHQFLEQYNPSYDLPIPIEEIAEIKLGLELSLVPNLKTSFTVDALITSDFSRIILDEKCFSKFPQRSRFSIAHEIGHMVLHADWYKHFGPKNIEEGLVFQEKLSDEEYSFAEIQANTFAGLILVPKDSLISEVRKLVGHTRRFPLSPLPEMQPLIDIFNVSADVVLWRLVREEIVPNPKTRF